MQATSLNNTAVLVTPSRELAVGLAALLLTIPPIAHVERLSQPDALLRNLKSARPKLVVLDSGAAGADVPDVVAAIERESPDTRHLVLSDTIAEAERLAADGVEPVAVKGVDPAWLAAMLEDLLFSDAGPGNPLPGTP